MKDREDFSKVIADISILFELSLAVGQSLDLRTNCDRFLKTLMARKNLGYSSVWIKGEYLVDLPEEILLEDRDENSAFLVYANPEFGIKEKSIPPHHLIFSMLEGKEAFSIASTEDRFSEIITEKGIDKGIFAIFSLGKLGFLKLFSMMRETPFGEEELNQLKNVISKFTVSLEGCIAHQKVTREISERKRAEEELLRSEEEARHLAQENAIMAEIGQVISLTLNIEEIYERFAKEVRKLIPFDRIAINLINPDKHTATVTYTTGVEIPERFHGNIIPLSGTFTEEVMRTRKNQLIQGEEKEIASRFPGFLFSLKVGLRSRMSVPLISKIDVIGVLDLRSTKPNAYTERDLRLAERVGHQIAGAIANAQLFAERKRAEEALQKSEALLKLQIARMPIGCIMWSPEFCVLLWNPAAERIFRFTADEILGKHPYDFIVPKDMQPHVDTIWQRLLEADTTAHSVNENMTKDGRIITCEWNNTPIKEADGTVVGVLSMVQDITERKRAEEALRESEQKYRSLVNNIKLGIFRSTPGPYGKFIEVNLAMEEITGYSREELLSINVSDLYIRAEEREIVVAEVATATGKTTRELNFRKKDGAEMVVSDTKGAVKDKTGKVLYFDGIIEEITERKQAEEALKQSEEETRRLAQETAIIADIGRIISSTLKIEEVYERFADELRKVLPFDRVSINIVNVEENIVTVPYAAGIPVPGRQPGENYPLAGSFTEVAIRARKATILQLENEVTNRFSHLLPVFRAGLRSAMMVPLISKGQAIGVLHFLSKKPDAYNNADLELAETVSAQIAEAIANAQLFLQHKQDMQALEKAYAQLKQTQAQLIQAEKGEVISRLASGVAHQVKNPLAIILQGIDYLYANVPLDNENVSFTFRDIKNAVRRADNIIKGLLDFSRVGERKRAPRNLNPIIEGALLFVESLLDTYHIEVIKEFGKDILSLNLDKIRIEQLFLNLFINVIDAMPVGGQLKIRTYNKELTEVSEEVGRGEGDIFKPGDTAVIAEIEDTGTGIPEGILEKIFDPFFTTKQNKGGTGLGLSVVRNIVEVHDGRIKIENRKDRSGVRVTLMFKA